MIYLVEHFFSIQGEGRYAGVPSIFLRFGGCNLRCPGFGRYEIAGSVVEGCDTLRAVDKRHFGVHWQSIDELKEITTIVEHYLEPLTYRPDLVITGGEPMIYAQERLFYGLIEWALAHGMRITIETNATLAPSFETYPAYCDVVFAMAVKLSNSGEPKKKRVIPEAIARLAQEGKDSFFKFTLDRSLIAKGGAEEIEGICGTLSNEVYCMPLGDTFQQLEKNALDVASFCLQYGYRYSDRLHVRLWNREERR